MKLEDQVCSLELAMKLKDLGINEECEFIWRNEERGCGWYLNHWSSSCLTYHLDHPAYTVAELGEMLPSNISYKNENLILKSLKYEPIHWLLSYVDIETNEGRIHFNGYSEADTRAKMIIYLIDNKLMEVPK